MNIEDIKQKSGPVNMKSAFMPKKNGMRRAS